MNARDKILAQFLGQQVHVNVDRPIGHTHKGIVYPINYGYLPGVMAGDGQEQDVYILGVEEPLAHFEGRIIGAVLRRNDTEDKLVAAPEGMRFHQGQIAEAVHFQEQYFDTRILSLFQKSCGVLAWKLEAGQRQYLLVWERGSRIWSLPKGHMEAGETEAETALRELWEETGLTAQLDTSRSVTVEYPIQPISRKQVLFFPGQVSGELRLRPGETEAFRWVRAEELAQHLFPDMAQACLDLIARMD